MVIALSLNNLGVVYWVMGDADRARPLYTASLALYRELDDKSGLMLALDNQSLCPGAPCHDTVCWPA
jgi:hypothetical protein